MTDRFDCFISAEKSKKYDALVDDPHSIFYKHNKSQVYIIAAAYGFHYNLRAPIEGKKQPPNLDLKIVGSICRWD